MNESVRPARLIATRQQQMLYVATGVVVDIVMVMFLIGALTGPRVSTAGLVAAAAFFVVVIVVWTYACCWRLPRTGVLVYADGVVVRNPLRQRAVPWGEIDRFAVESAGYQRGVMYLRNGERIELSGVQGQLQALFPRSEWASKPIGELNALLAKSRR